VYASLVFAKLVKLDKTNSANKDLNNGRIMGDPIKK
jgi:hypothetical protein